MIDARTRAQMTRFVIVGLIATGADASTYAVMLSTLLSEQYSASKAAAFVVGTTVAYLLNSRWTFAVQKRDTAQTARFFALYGVSFVLNVTMNSVTLQQLFGLGLAEGVAATVAFVVATGCSMVTTFVGQKLWVFRGA